MGNCEISSYLNVLRPGYQKAEWSDKQVIINQACILLNWHRKSVIRAFNRSSKGACKPVRRKKFSDLAQYHLRKLWLIMDQMCSKKMVVALPLWLSFYKGCSESVKQEILRISASTIDRYLHAYRVQHKRSFRSGTRAGSPWFKKLIPMRPLENHIQDWGHIEADTVTHCGNSLSGVFSWTLTLVDIQSGWTENTAMWGKSGQGVVCGIQAIERNMLFEMKGFYCDNGSEFLNKEVLKYFSCKGKRHLIQRGRPYKKNDQCHVEQKNYTHVRQLFGYVLPLLNGLLKRCRNFSK